MSNDKIEVVDRRKFSGLSLKDQWKPGGEFDPEQSTHSEWKEKAADAGFKYLPPEPLLYYVLVRQHGSEHHKHTRGFALNIEIPENYRQKPGMGVIVSIGSAVPEGAVKPGDIVKFGLLSEEVEFEGEKFQLVDYRDLKYVERIYKTEQSEEESEDVQTGQE